MRQHGGENKKHRNFVGSNNRNLLTVELAPCVLWEGPTEKADTDTRKLAAIKNFIVMYICMILTKKFCLEICQSV
jgi:hypothetical protein